MKTKILLACLLSILTFSCLSPEYLPTEKTIHINQYGSFIKIKCRDTVNVRGELIAIDSTKLIVLRNRTNTCVIIPLNSINGFKLRYAQPKHYEGSIFLFPIWTISHGILLLGTASINLIVTTSVTISGETAFKYNDKTMTFDKLRMFARFPQGIPENVNIKDIKYNK